MSTYQLLKNGINFTKKIKPENLEAFENDPSTQTISYQQRLLKNFDDVKQTNEQKSINQFSHNVLNYLKTHHIKLSGNKVQIPCPTLAIIKEEALICQELLNSAQEKFSFVNPTHIQACSIPNILQKRNFVGIAPTGTGKTLAYLLPICEMLRKSEKTCLIIAPTFELSVQIYKVCLKLIGKKKPLLGISIGHIQKLEKKEIDSTRILISTPASFLKISDSEEFASFVQKLEVVVLDEADKFFELSFLEQLEQLLTLFKTSEKQYVLVSATFPHEIEKAIEGSFIDRTQTVVGGKLNVLSTIDQKLVYCTNEEGKLFELENIINEGRLEVPCVIFMQSKDRVKEIFRICKGMNICADYLHNDLSLLQREKKVREFEEGKIWVLITSDLLARGMDFPNLKLVINFDIPTSNVTYIHRVGRTGRAGHKGKAITLFTNEDKAILRRLADLLKQSNCEVPEWIFEISKIDKKEIRKVEKNLQHRDSLVASKRIKPSQDFREEIKRKDHNFYRHNKIEKDVQDEQEVQQARAEN